MKVRNIGKNGEVVIPAALRKRFGLTQGRPVTFVVEKDGLKIRPAEVLEVEVYTPERKAEFLLGGATSKKDYLAMCEEVRKRRRKSGGSPRRAD